MKGKLISIRISEELAEELSQKLGKGNRSAYLTQLIKDDLRKTDDGEELTGRDKATIHDQEVKLDKIIGDSLVKALQSKKENIFEKMDDETLARLAIQRMPKPKDVDSDLQADALSLKKALETMPSQDDLTQELSRTKHDLNKVKYELEVNAITVQSLRKKLIKDDPEAWELFKKAADKLKEYCLKHAKDGGTRGFDIEFIRPLIIREGSV